MIVLDESVLIAHLDQHDAHHRQASELLLTDSRCEFVASAITLAEVLVALARAGMRELAVGALRALAVRELPLEPGDAPRLAQLRSETKLKLPNCCVLLAAQHHHAALLTFDSRLAAAASELAIAVDTRA